MRQQINLLNPLLRQCAVARTPVQLSLPFDEPAALSPKPTSLPLLEPRVPSPLSYAPVGLPNPGFESVRNSVARMPPPR